MTHFNPAVITPYYSEDAATLKRCHESCQQQTTRVRHFLVADGKPNLEVAGWDVEHLILSKPHADYGNTPRGIGALSAINQGHNPILFLDADNWYDSAHVQTALEFKTDHPDVDIAASMRELVLPDGTLVESDPEDAQRQHIDTSCLALFESSFFLLPLWCTMTKPLSVIGDRIIFHAMRQHQLNIGWTGQRTLFYTTNYRHHYLRAGQRPPAETYKLNTKELDSFDSTKLYQWSRLRISLNKQKSDSNHG